ncbi:MAG: pyruvate formate lyase family protein [Candidatus Sumerlaeota bacterium]
MHKNPALSDEQRIATIRKRHLERKRRGAVGMAFQRHPAHLLEALEETEAESNWTLRRGKILRHLQDRFRFEVDDCELLLGRPRSDAAFWEEGREAAQEILHDEYPDIHLPGQTGHCEVDMTRLFARGIDGMIEEIKSRRDAAAGHKADTFHSFVDALDGFSLLIEHAAESAEEALESATPERCEELRKMAAICRRVAHEAPQTFREALQLNWMVTVGCKLDNAALVGPGHMDRFLHQYYEADLAAGRLTREEALLLIECYYLLINDFTNPGLAVGCMVGGRDNAGRDITNPISYLGLEALGRTKLVYPTVGVCWHEGTPDGLTQLAIDLIADGYSTVAFFGDETIQRGLQMYGVPKDEACDYINSTCVEITPTGSSNVWVASPYHPVCSYLRDEIAEQVHVDDVAPDFQAFVKRYRRRLDKHIQDGVERQNEWRCIRKEKGGKPLQSVFTRDCIERGLDIDEGGAKYNWVECSFVGLANFADSMHVIREEIYERKRLTMAELWKMLESNFDGREVDRLRLAKTYPKYGNDNSEVDRYVNMLVEWTREECGKYKMVPDDSPHIPGAFCWIQHERLGSACGATPDGRRAGFPFADGAGGAQGRELEGPTAAARSVTSWDHAPMIGGTAFNMKFNKSLFEDSTARESLKSLVQTFLVDGGFEVQINMLDADVLEEARANPEAWEDLVVRIGGYTDYFTRLSPGMQEEVIMRTRYESMA